MAIKLEMFRCLSAVARTGTLRDGAELVSKTPSAVSMTLKQLEEHIGQPLFEKDRKNKLTSVGAFVLEQAERELQHFDRTLRTIQDFAGARQGHVRLAVVPSVAGAVMPRFYATHMEALENLHLEVRDMDSASVLQELFWDRVDIGIATVGDRGMGLDSTPLLTDRFGIVARPDHPIAHGSGPVDWTAVQGVRLIANNLSAAIAHPVSQDLHRQSNLSAHNLTSMLAMVRAGIGVTILPEMAVGAPVLDDLVFRALNDPDAVRRVQLLRKTTAPGSPAEDLVANGILATARQITAERHRGDRP
ncbi:LysR substrate-binding domain-containing protein [uncultured Tateyamaria sp.]|uniref:LysR family transcriptional regulator n=1 Tax=Tateyamaria sp. 1078 TaxID=3417464 RepID=UPI0026221942|nr:LysR substrate-binding domain-containing protein [uncultured Tateyamaria sp.]